MRNPAGKERTGWTRAQLLRGALGGGAAVGGGAVLATRAGGGSAEAAPSSRQDADILGLFLTLETLQRSFYRGAIRSGELDGALLTFARAAAAQEDDHVALLRRRLGGRRARRHSASYAGSTGNAKRFTDTAIDLEELTIAAYIGQGGNLTRDAVALVVPMVSVEARQVAWVRDLAKRTPAPRAADPARPPDAVLADLRTRGYLR